MLSQAGKQPGKLDSTSQGRVHLRWILCRSLPKESVAKCTLGKKETRTMKNEVAIWIKNKIHGRESY